jgi:hypothetical protein
MRHGDALVTPRSDATLRPSGAGRRYPLSRVTNQPADAAPIASDSTAALGKRRPVAFGENGPGLACGAQGIWPGPCSVGDGSIPTVPVRPDDACPMLSRLARPCAEPGRQYSAAPRPSVRRLQSFGVAATLRAACSRVSRRYNWGERHTKKIAPRRSGAVCDVGKEPRVEKAAADSQPSEGGRRGLAPMKIPAEAG